MAYDHATEQAALDNISIMEQHIDDFNDPKEDLGKLAAHCRRMRVFGADEEIRAALSCISEARAKYEKSLSRWRTIAAEQKAAKEECDNRDADRQEIEGCNYGQ